MSEGRSVNEKRWQPGDAVILRNTGFFVGEAWATPHIVVRDSDDLVVLYRPEGTPFESWSLVEERIWPVGSTRMDMLRLMYPGALLRRRAVFRHGARHDAVPLLPRRWPVSRLEGEHRGAVPSHGARLRHDGPFPRRDREA